MRLTMRHYGDPYLSLRPAFLPAACLPYDGFAPESGKVRRKSQGGHMDVLSEVLKVVKLQGALFYNGEFSSPWSIRATSSQALARYFAAGAQHVIIYHLLTQGRASVRMDSGQRVTLNAGDLVMLPHGDPHIMENGPPTKTVDESEQIAEVLSQGLKLWRLG